VIYKYILLKRLFLLLILSVVYDVLLLNINDILLSGVFSLIIFLLLITYLFKDDIITHIVTNIVLRILVIVEALFINESIHIEVPCLEDSNKFYQ